MRNGPLDMRMDSSSEITAADLVNNLTMVQLSSAIQKVYLAQMYWH